MIIASTTAPETIYAAVASDGIRGIPWLFWVAAAVVTLNMIANARKKKRQRAQGNGQPAQRRNPHPNVPAHPHPQANTAGRTGVAHGSPAQNAPYVGTTLNGVPLKDYDTSHGHHSTGFANERMRAEAELRRQLDSLDAARRAGQVSAEDYAGYREAIFKNF